ncbi:MAG: hypothetical protein M5U26_21610 [Planctomycetota bacterium]|nr:hypothetical protein [Planctomycetota bacterium]
MLRSAVAGCGLFLVVGLVWAFYDPLISLNDVARLDGRNEDPVRVEALLMQRGRGATWALRQGLTSGNAEVRLRSAGLLALMGEEGAQPPLLEALARGDEGGLAVLAERLLLATWDARNGPEDPQLVRDLRRMANPNLLDGDTRRELDLLLTLHPYWVGGFVARGRYHFHRGNYQLASKDLLDALLLEPQQFEAVAMLGRCFLHLGYADGAASCLEQALRINPRLRSDLDADLQTARKEAAADREELMRQRRLDRPLG